MPYTHAIHRSQKPRTGIAHGGIGAGWFEMRADGCSANWNIFNNRPLGWGKLFTFDTHDMVFFKARVEIEGEHPAVYFCQIEGSHDTGGLQGHEYHYIYPWLHGAETIETEETFPFTRYTIRFRDLAMVFRLRVWSPFIPFDVKNSSLPVAFFDFEIESQLSKPVKVNLVASLRNAVGYAHEKRAPYGNVIREPGLHMVEMGDLELDAKDSSWGTMAVASLADGSAEARGWAHPHPYYETLLRQTKLDGFEDTAGKKGLEYCFNSVAKDFDLDNDHRTLRHSFAIGWNFPNNYVQPADDMWRFKELEEEAKKQGASDAWKDRSRNEGVYYTNFFSSAAEAVRYAARNRADLLARTEAFHNAFFASSLPTYVLDAVNAQLNTFRTSSWLTKAKDFGIIEGLGPKKSFAGLTTVDVAMYGSIATAALFPELDLSSWWSHIRLQRDNGIVAHSISYNFAGTSPGELDGHRIDLPAQFTIQALRAYRMTGDEAFLKAAFPAAVKALEYGLRERDKNGDGLPDLEGIMTSYDNFPMYGVAPFVATQWIAAYRMVADTARQLGETAIAERFDALYAKGRRLVEEKTWNGEYFNLCHDDSRDPAADNQCMVDQLAGQSGAFLAGDGFILDREHVQTAMASIMRRNYYPEQGLRNCTKPGSGYVVDVSKDTWVDQANTCWTGVEFLFAGALLFADRVEEAFTIVRNIEERHRHYGMAWDHQEFGGHYYRAMSAWAVILGAAGQQTVTGTYRFAPKLNRPRYRLLFTFNGGYGHLVSQAVEGGREITWQVLSGTWSPAQVELMGLYGDATASAGQVTVDERAAVVRLPKGFELRPSQSLTVTVRS